MKLLIKTVFILIFLGCADSSDKTEMYSNDYGESEEITLDRSKKSANPQKSEPSNSVETQRKLIKKGNISFETNDLSKTKKRISEGVTKYNGYIANDNEYKSSGKISNSLIVRIPSKHFDAFLEEVSVGVTKFDSKNISVNDVTEEFLDVQARLKVKKALESRYSELLKKAKSVKEVLEVERELANVRADIESVEGRLRYLQSQVSFSTLTINYYRVEKTHASEDGFGYRLARAFNNGVSNIKSFFIGLINIWPFIILIILIYFFIKKRFKK